VSQAVVTARIPTQRIEAVTLAFCTRSACIQMLLLCGLRACLPMRPNPQGGAKERADVPAAHARSDAASVVKLTRELLIALRSAQRSCMIPLQLS
jgi:hypothetical protein